MPSLSTSEVIECGQSGLLEVFSIRMESLLALEGEFPSPCGNAKLFLDLATLALSFLLASPPGSNFIHDTKFNTTMKPSVKSGTESNGNREADASPAIEGGLCRSPRCFRYHER